MNDQFPVRGVPSNSSTHGNSAVLAPVGGDPAVNRNLGFRVFNDAAADRYNAPGTGRHHVAGESSAWNLPVGSMLWHLGGKKRSCEERHRGNEMEEYEPGTGIMALSTAELSDAGEYTVITKVNLVRCR